MIKCSNNNNNNNGGGGGAGSSNVSNLISLFQNMNNNTTTPTNATAATTTTTTHHPTIGNIAKFKYIEEIYKKTGGLAINEQEAISRTNFNNSNNNNTTLSSYSTTPSTTPLFANNNYIKEEQKAGIINNKNEEEREKEADVNVAVNKQQRLMTSIEFKDKLAELSRKKDEEQQQQQQASSSFSTSATSVTMTPHQQKLLLFGSSTSQTDTTMVALSETELSSKKVSFSKMSIISNNDSVLADKKSSSNAVAVAVEESEYENPKKVHFDNTYETVNSNGKQLHNEDTFTSIPLGDEYEDTVKIREQQMRNLNDYSGLDIDLDEILSNIETIKTEIIDEDEDEEERRRKGKVPADNTDPELISSHNPSVNALELIDESSTKNEVKIVDSLESEIDSQKDNICKFLFKKFFCLNRPSVSSS